MITNEQLVSAVQVALAEKWGYVYGSQGQIYSKELAVQWGNAKRSGKTYQYFVIDCARWFGRKVVDCSGLLVEAFREYDSDFDDRSASGFFSQATEKGPISTIPDIPGLGVWRQGHIGLYIGNGEIIEARGHTFGVVKTKVKDRDFTHWCKLRDVDYNDIVDLPDDPINEAFRLNRLLKYEPMSGPDVEDVQIALKILGYDLGDITGKYDALTAESVRQFQIEHGLQADGVVGKQTAEALGGVWSK